MLVATFGPTTAWEGREIIWDADHFTLAGHGAIPAAGLLDYDRRGQLVWADVRYRSWVAAVHQWERGRRGVLPARGAAAPAAAPWQAGAVPAASQTGRRGGVPAWAVVVVAVVTLALVAAVAIAVVLPSLVQHTTQTLGHDMVVRADIQAIRTGIESYAADHGGRFPGAGEVSPAGMGRYISPWPRNPYTGMPMADGGGEGNFRYDLSPDGGAYRIFGYGRGGATVIELSGGSPDTV